MSQPDDWGMQSAAPASPTAVAARVNGSFGALLTGHSGPTRPAYAEDGTIWQDTSTEGLMRVYFYDGSDDILLCEVDTATNRVERAPQPLVDIASASSMDLGAVKSENLRVTGTTGPTSFGTARIGTFRRLYFAGNLTITRNATTLETHTGANLAIGAGDHVEVVSLGSGNWRVLSHLRITALSQAEILALFNATGSAPVYAARAFANLNGTGTPALRRSGNISSLVDNGTGDYTLNYGVAVPVDCAVNITAIATGSTALFGPAGSNYNPSTTGCRLNVRTSANALADVEYVNFIVTG